MSVFCALIVIGPVLNAVPVSKPPAMLGLVRNLALPRLAMLPRRDTRARAASNASSGFKRRLLGGRDARLNNETP